MPCGLFRQMCSYHFPSYLSKSYSLGKCVFKKQVIFMSVFCLTLFADATATHLTLQKSSLLKIQITVYLQYFLLPHSKKGVSCAMMLMPRRVGIWTGDWMWPETYEQTKVIQEPPSIDLSGPTSYHKGQ